LGESVADKVTLTVFSQQWAFPAVKDKGDDLHLNFRKLDVLVGILGLGLQKIGVPARTALGFEWLDLAGFQELLPMTLGASSEHRVFWHLACLWFFSCGGSRWIATD
jgi:hypothetical protein